MDRYLVKFRGRCDDRPVRDILGRVTGGGVATLAGRYYYARPVVADNAWAALEAARDGLPDGHIVVSARCAPIPAGLTC